MKSQFTCYIEGRGSQWEAACMDFDVFVSGKALDEVKMSLELAVRSYVLSAQDELEPARTQVLNRYSGSHQIWRANVGGTGPYGGCRACRSRAIPLACCKA